jgi:hypothetical protein
MLMGRIAAPLPDGTVAASVVGDRLDGTLPAVIEAVPGRVPVGTLRSDLMRHGFRPVWARLAPYEIDAPSLRTLARAVLGHVVPGPGAWEASRPPGGDDEAPGEQGSLTRPVAVVESPDRPRAEALLEHVVPALDREPGRGSAEGVVLHLTGGEGIDSGQAAAGVAGRSRTTASS